MLGMTTIFWIQYNGDWALTKGNSYYDTEKAQLSQTRIEETFTCNIYNRRDEV